MKVIYIYLEIKSIFYLDYVLQGFVLTILTPALFTAILMGFASFIRKQWLYYCISTGVSLIGSALLFMGLMYYRLQTHFIFFPRKIATASRVSEVQHNFFTILHVGDFIFVFDFVIVLFVFLVLLVFSRQNGSKLKVEARATLEDYQKMTSSLHLALNQAKKELAHQKAFLGQLKDGNGRLKDNNVKLLQKKALLQEKCSNSQPGLQKELVYLQAENTNLSEGMKKWKVRIKQLEQMEVQKRAELREYRKNHVTIAEKIERLSEEKKKIENTLDFAEKNKFEALARLEQAKEIAQNVYEEMLSYSVK
ncbi:hypothetical protein [Lactococcus allomyrinae]|uniref:hypothetical protein n=1 Tax=Lactococcus allomyrinae TaxID=2419773 RepID=UPI0013C50F6E|nr:hypothetical protein [Lactococcus allomyrinae]